MEPKLWRAMRRSCMSCLHSGNCAHMAGKDMHTVDCACGKVQLEVSGSPMQSWCHCCSCAKFHQTTPVAFVMFAADDVKITQGQDHIQRFSLRKASMGRFFCAGCGFRLYNQPDGVPFRGMPASNLDISFEPSMHVFCQDADASALKPFSSDGLPKYKDLPDQNGGSGDTLQL